MAEDPVSWSNKGGFIEMDDPEMKRVYKVSNDALDFIQDLQLLIRAARAAMPAMCGCDSMDCGAAKLRRELELALRPFQEE
jgi:hypothetical protein